MAGDWIKMRTGLRTHPKVVRMMSGLKADTLRVIGGLFAVWSVFDEHAEEGRLIGYNADAMDATVGWEGFTAAMISVQWLTVEDVDGMQTLVATRYSEHNGATAKQRAQDTRRKKESRDADSPAANGPRSVRKMSGTQPDKSRTREEKSNTYPQPPSTDVDGGSETSSNPVEDLGSEVETGAAIAFSDWLQVCRERGETPVPAESEPMRYAASIALPVDVLALHWGEFKARGLMPGAKRSRDWLRAFELSLRNNAFRLWRVEPAGGFVLTDQGRQAQLAQQDGEAAE